jgi:alkylation response protein AidB-like acyl-CoA dehydrogenase
LGFFQGVKHPLVNVMLAIDETKSLAYNAACAYDCDEPNTPKAGHLAKASAADTADFSASRAVQMHGGIGFTWECYVHLYFKRQMHSKALYGDAMWHRAKLADIVFGPAAA